MSLNTALKNHLTRQTAYVSCHDELPPTNGVYFVELRDGSVLQMRYYADETGNGWFRITNGEEHYYDHVIGWWEK